MIDKRALSDDLTKAFINYQYRLDNPMPDPHRIETQTEMEMEIPYRNDYVFRSKVDSLVGGVMHIISKHEKEEG